MNAPIPIALLLDGGAYGGTERHVRDLVLGMGERAPGSFAPELILAQDGPFAEAMRGRGIPTHIEPRPGALAYVRGVAARIRAGRYALVHAHSGRLACLGARLGGAKTVIETRHGLIERVNPHYLRRARLAALEGVKSRLATRSIAVCAADRDWLLAQGGFSARSVVVIRNGIGPVRPSLPSRSAVRERWGIPPAAPLLGFGGRLVPQKQPERVLDLFAALAARHSSVELVLCGDGPLLPALRSRVSGAPWGERAQFRGPEELPDLLAAADLLLAPSLHEGLPYLLLEAMSIGLPLLATPVGGVAELLSTPELEASLADWDLGEWTQRASQIFTARTLRTTWASAAARRLDDYRLDAMIDATLELYRRELGLPPRPR
ncbi:MAG: glycosyltransferase family 4 protein [Candidatus Eisenbacteria bacterium]|nr:glycosyltransferase family 4 protein [Candidatus Eisenbacteria bacterium]